MKLAVHDNGNYEYTIMRINAETGIPALEYSIGKIEKAIRFDFKTLKEVQEARIEMKSLAEDMTKLFSNISS